MRHNTGSVVRLVLVWRERSGDVEAPTLKIG